MNAPAVDTHAQPAAATGPTLSQRVARFASGLRYEDIPAEVRERAKYLMLDAIGIAFASTHYPFSRHVLSGTSSLGGRGDIAVIGFDQRLPLRDAVLMNATLVHGLDYDDTHVGAIVHPTASALPCALGVAEAVDASGRDLLTAYVLGVETVIRVCGAAKGGFHHFGFHPTGIAAHFSCAMQAGWLYGLNEHQLVMAQGFVGSTAAASQEFLEEGAWNKRVHPGWAGVAGITAAVLARNGYVGPTKPYEGRFGLYRSHLADLADQCDFEMVAEGLGSRWETSVVAIKPFPICHLIHACADSALALHEKHHLRPEDIESIEALIPEPTIHIIAQPEERKKVPLCDYDAKFSVQFVVATCLVRGCFGLAELESDVLGDRVILDLAAKVTYSADPETTFPKYFSGGLVIRTKDGRTLKHHEPVNRGAGDRALSGEDIERKYMENASMAIPERRALAIRDAVLGMENQSARELASMLNG